MTDSMIKFNHRMSAEESIFNFIAHLEEGPDGAPLSEGQKSWLYKKGQEIFDTYYIDEAAQVNLATQKDKDVLMAYFTKVQETLGSMFAHIMLIEFKLHLLIN
jgi:hypothetical protein